MKTKPNTIMYFSEATANDVQGVKQFLASGRSYYQHELERKLYFISKEKTEKNTKTQMERVMKTVCKPKTTMAIMKSTHLIHMNF